MSAVFCAGGKMSSKGARVLLIEDEPLIAENLRADLVDAGFEVVGLASRLDRAIRLIGELHFDAAIVDANLAGVSAAPAAAALSLRKAPFIVLSGYAPDQLPSEFSQALYLQKPYRIPQLIQYLTGLIRREGV